uniref:Sec14 cytosolic factor-like isoform X2 n=1 Tax=Rhizophora mucronata TaxID=61149 RepID=A0A2P2J968_RHIMU
MAVCLHRFLGSGSRQFLQAELILASCSPQILSASMQRNNQLTIPFLNNRLMITRYQKRAKFIFVHKHGVYMLAMEYKKILICTFFLVLLSMKGHTIFHTAMKM